MKLLQTIRDKLARKTPCYECGKPTAHTHKVHINFHGTLTHAEVCDACFAKLKGHAEHSHRA